MYAHRPTRVEIDLDALGHNYNLVRSALPPASAVLAVVKADAYGHGAVAVARHLQQLGADMFGVAMVEEGLELRRSGISVPILMLGGLWPGQEDVVVANDLQVAVFDAGRIERLNRAAQLSGSRCLCHLKIDTGMGRLGVLPQHLAELLTLLRRCPHLEVAGVMSHLAVADEVGHPYTARQVELFCHCLEQVRAAGFAPQHIHISNSAATFAPLCAECTLVRPGIALYGGQPTPSQPQPLRPVMNFRTEIAHLKQLPSGSSVSYGRHFTSTRPTLIAAIPVGYADGYNRLLSNGAEVLVRGRRVPVAGNVCMDWTLLDVTDVPGVCAGDQVTLLGGDGAERISAEEWAQRIGTISYEVFCQISKRVPRRYICSAVG